MLRSQAARSCCRAGSSRARSLWRAWKGKSHRVTVLADGFVYDGNTYSNLSEIAILITGTRWNGPRFFGLRSKAEDSSEPADINPSGGSKPDSNADSIHLRPAGGGRSRGRRNIGGFGKSAANGDRHGS